MRVTDRYNTVGISKNMIAIESNVGTVNVEAG
jgi:hypothetical protein